MGDEARPFFFMNSKFFSKTLEENGTGSFCGSNSCFSKRKQRRFHLEHPLHEFTKGFLQPLRHRSGDLVSNKLTVHFRNRKDFADCTGNKDLIRVVKSLTRKTDLAYLCVHLLGKLDHVLARDPFENTHL